MALVNAADLGVKHRSLAFAIVPRVSPAQAQALLAQDVKRAELLHAFEASGIEERLRAAGRRWYALVPAWRTGPGSELLCFLNPAEQRKFAGGWFTLLELEQWAKGTGPVVWGNAAEEPLRERD